MHTSYILTAVCDNRAGILAGVTSALYAEGADITVASQFDDTVTNRFFIRMMFIADDALYQSGHLQKTLESAAEKFNMEWHLRPKNELKNVLIMVSKLDHCLSDLLYRHSIGELAMNIVGIVCNHPQSALNIAIPDHIPFHHLPVNKENKAKQETQIKVLIDKDNVDLLILARYMQILSDDFSAYMSGRCINIHHSSLPSFKGAKPYHQAYERGVKLIGATAHFVTADLDEGPIIEQDIEYISHRDTPEDLVKKGRDIERRVLAKAVSYALEDRVFLNGVKTVVFHD